MVEEWQRLLDFGLRLHAERTHVIQDLGQLAKKFELASTNHAKAYEYVKQLEQIQAQTSQTLQNQDGLQLRESEIKLAEVERLIHEHRLKRKLFENATVRIYGILRLNEIFLEFLEELAQNTRATLISSLDLLRYYARGEEPPKYLLGEYRQACGRLCHPLRIYQQL